MQFKHNQFIANLPETLTETLNDSDLIGDRKQKNIHRTNCHEGLSASNPNAMACMFNKYFASASNNNTGESLAFVGAEIAIQVAVMTSSVAKIIFFG